MNNVRILVVDDEADFEGLINRRFRREIREGRFDFLFARDGVEGLEATQAHDDIHIVLCDINMPHMDGLTLLGHLTEMERVICPVMVSAYGDMNNIRTAMNRGAFDFVTKPIDFDDMRATIEKAIQAVGALRERQIIRDLFGRYLPTGVADAVLENEGVLEPQTKEATILFADIVSFTAFVEGHSPTDVVVTLNEYFSVLVEIIERYGGVVTQFLGDGILAVFNVPVAVENHQQRAVEAAIEIQQTVGTSMFNGQQLECRIGLATGNIIAGNVGASERLSYTVYGEAVNLASRLEQLNKKHGTSILISSMTADETTGIDLKEVGKVDIRGSTSRVSVYTTW